MRGEDFTRYKDYGLMEFPDSVACCLRSRQLRISACADAAVGLLAGIPGFVFGGQGSALGWRRERKQQDGRAILGPGRNS